MGSEGATKCVSAFPCTVVFLPLSSLATQPNEKLPLKQIFLRLPFAFSWVSFIQHDPTNKPNVIFSTICRPLLFLFFFCSFFCSFFLTFFFLFSLAGTWLPACPSSRWPTSNTTTDACGAQSDLADYSNKQWGGLLLPFYSRRQQCYVDTVKESGLPVNFPQ